MAGYNMAEKILCKIAYNGIDKENWIENRDPVMQKVYRDRSTFLSIKRLEKSGRDLQADLEKKGMQTAPREFAKLENMDY